MKRFSNKIKVLIIDDQPFNNFIIKTFIEKIDNGRNEFEIFLESDPEKALKIAEEKIPDIIFLDFDMPKMDGIEFYKKIREKPSLKDTQICFISAFDKNFIEKEKNIKLENDVKFISKPVKLEDIRNIILDLINKKLYKD